MQCLRGNTQHIFSSNVSARSSNVQAERACVAAPSFAKLTAHMQCCPLSIADQSLSRHSVIAAASSAPIELVTGSIDGDGERLEQALVERFHQADTDGNGVIDREELRALLENFEGGMVAPPDHEHWLTDEEVDKVLQQYDTGGNGSLDQLEFKQLAKDGVLLHGTLHQYSQAFDAVDADHDGQITADQLVKLFGRIGSKGIDSKRIEAEFDSFDSEHKGSLGFYQFIRLFRHRLLDLESVVDYLHNPLPLETADQPASEAAAAQVGEVQEITSEEELDTILREDPKFTILLAGFTWCRPCKALQMPYQKMAKHYTAARWLKFYGNTNESTKLLFRDRLKARATPTLAFFDEAGNMVHQHTGANKSRLEYYLRQFLPQSELNGDETVYPAYKLTEKELEEQATNAQKEAAGK